jgi:hypothetical protein
MAGQRQSVRGREAFIQVRENVPDAFNCALRATEASGGRVRHAYPPWAIIAELPSGVIARLRKQEAIAFIATGEVDRERLTGLHPELKMAVSVWNEHLRSRRRGRLPGERLKGLSWGSPGLLPPDPPLHIQEKLRQREREGE